MKKVLLLLLFSFALLGTNSARTDSLMIRYSDWNRETIDISTCSNFEWMHGYDKEYVVSFHEHVDSGSRRDRCLGQERPHARCRLVRLKRMRKGQINFWHFKRQLL